MGSPVGNRQIAGWYASQMGKAQAVWLSYDLGLQGDYEGLYKWLGEWGAEECGDSVAFFKYPYKTDLVREMTKDIKQDVRLSGRARLYLIYKDEDSQLRGRFLVGGRRRPPWAEYALRDVVAEDIGLSETDTKQGPARPKKRVNRDR